MIHITVTTHNIREMHGYITSTGRKTHYLFCTRNWYFSDTNEAIDIWTTIKVRFP